jgi:glycogen debranching enzyme
METQSMTPEEAAKLTSTAVQILRDNDFGGYTVPTRGLYPFQWNWDACLNALGWAKVDEARAWLEITTLFDAQWDDGMVPHIIFHRHSDTYFPGPDTWRTGRQPSSSGITQPPVAATAVRYLLEQAEDRQLAQTQAKTLLHKLYRYHRWYRSARDPDNTGLVAVLHPWESGWDNSPAWDEALAAVPLDKLEPFVRKDTKHVHAQFRPTQANYNAYIALLQLFREHHYDPATLYHVSPFRMADLCVNSILLRADKDLSWLAEKFGDYEIQKAANDWNKRGSVAFQSLWDEKESVYKSRDLVTGKLVSARSSAAFLALYADLVPAQKLTPLMDTYDRWMSTVRFAVPSVPATDPRFDAKRYWRGPLWPHLNFMLADGLRQYGFRDRAARVLKDTAEVITGAGFFEYFDPLDGSGAGGDQFSWTAAMWLGWLEPGLSETGFMA